MYFFSTLFSIFGSIFTLFAFLLQLFVLIGQLSNRPFLRNLYYGQAINSSQNTALNFNLWNYCSADMVGNVQSCSRPVPAYNWASTPEISNVVQAQSQSTLVKGLFLGLFCLVFIGTGLSLIFWLMSLPICCLCRKRRAPGVSMSTLLFINFLVTLVALILALVICLRGIRILHAGDNNWSGNAGNSMWLTIGAVVSLFLAFLCYSVGSCCCARRKDAVDPAEKSHYGGALGAPNSPYAQGQGTVLMPQQQQQQQQPYGQYTPQTGAQQAYVVPQNQTATGYQNQPAAGYQTQTAAGYQTPTLSNTTPAVN